MDPVVALEIGTSKTVALVGEVRDDGALVVTGKGEHATAGVRKGEIIDPENVLPVVRRALADAGRNSHVTINEVVLAINSGSIRGSHFHGGTPVSSPDGTISMDDIEEVQELARAVHLPDDREMIHSIDQNYFVDDYGPVVNPEGMVGAKLTLNVLGFHGVRSLIQTAQRTVERLSVQVQESVFGGLASALAVLTPAQKRSGVLVIDLGAGTTDYVAYADEVMACGGSLGVGGDHVTNDIVIGFNIAHSRAEKIKRDYGSAMVLDTEDPPRIPIPAELGFASCQLNVCSMNRVIHERMKETFEKIRKPLEENHTLSRLGSGIVLTGGGAKMKDIHALAERVFGLPCVTGTPRNVLSREGALDGPEYATCCGLIDYAFRIRELQDDDDSFLQIGNWMRKLLGRD